MIDKPNKALYLQLVDDILMKLTTGQFKVGDRLPPEADYALTLGVSRSTLRLAFSQLEQLGIIKRRKRGGTEIISVKPIPRYSMNTRENTNVLSVTRNTLFEVSDVRTVGTDDFDVLENFAEESIEWLRCTGVRKNIGESVPFIWSQIFVSEQYTDISVQVGDKPTSIYAIIEQKFNQSMSRVKQRYSAELCDAEVADALGLKQSDAVLSAHAELYNSKDELLLFARSFFDSKRFKIITDVDVSSRKLIAV